MNDLDKALAAAREVYFTEGAKFVDPNEKVDPLFRALGSLITALDAARGQAVAYALPKALAETRADGFTVVRAGHQHHADGTYCVPVYLAPPAAACPNLTPMGECIKARQAVIEGTRVGLRLARGEFEVVAELGEPAPPAAVFKSTAKRVAALQARDAEQAPPAAVVLEGYALVPVGTLLDFKAWFSTSTPIGIALRKRVDELLAAAQGVKP